MSRTQRIKKICILAAGFGTRLQFSKFSSKALVPFEQASALDYLLNLVPEETEIVIAVNYFENDIKNYLEIAQPNRKIVFVNVPTIDAANSGPGMSLLACQKELQEPFILMACDSLPKTKISFLSKTNWMGGFSKVTKTNYLNLIMSNDLIVDFKYQSNNSKKTQASLCFSGLACIIDYELFFAGLEEGITKFGSGEVIWGFRNLREKQLSFNEIDWYETGNDNDYAKLSEGNNFHIHKEDEYIYFQSNKVIKFFKTIEKANKFFARSVHLIDLAPNEIQQKGRFVAYRYVDGTLLSYEENSERILEVLNLLQTKLWIKKCSEELDLQKMANQFYRCKTHERIKLAISKLGVIDSQIEINNKKLASLEEQLAKIDWEGIFNMHLSYFHGDPQPENIIIAGREITFIDWRTDFADNLEWGDCYYDLAKLYHALIISGRAVRNGNYLVEQEGGAILLSFDTYPNLIDMLKKMENWCVSNLYDLNRIRVITALIYLNISPLHDREYGRFLFYLGRYLLNFRDEEWNNFVSKL